MYYQDVFKALTEQKVRYLVVGAVAMNLYGAPRMTSDLDIMLDLTRSNLDNFITAMTDLGFKPKPPIEIKDLLDPANRKRWSNEKNMTVFTLYKPKLPYLELDIFIENPVDFKTAYKNRFLVNVSGLAIPIASIDDLISLKEKAGRRHDKSDIIILKKLKMAAHP